VAVMEQYLNFNVSISDDKIVVDYTDVYQDEKLVNLINEFPIVSSDMQVEYQFLGIDYRVDQASITHIYRIYKQIGINQYIYELSIGINPEGKVWYFLVYG
jgi:hypothetical protein